MSEEWSGPEPDDVAAPADPGVAERLIREEFSDASPAHRTWFHREAKEPAAGAPADGKGPDPDADAASGAVFEEEVVPATHPTAAVPVVASDPSPTDATIAVGAAAIHEAFVEPRRPPRSRSHRGGMLAGLGVVGALLAVLVVLAPGGSKPRLPAQSVHDVSPVTASGPKTEAATTPSTTTPSTTSSSPASTTTTPQPHQNETITTFITYSLVPGATPAVAPATAPSDTTTTAPPQTTTTTTTPPSTTTTTTPTKHCFLVCL
jgi:hypothetical protein